MTLNCSFVLLFSYTMLTQEVQRGLFLTGLHQVDTGNEMLTVIDDIGAMLAAQENVVDDEVNSLDDFNYVGSPHHY